MDRNVRMVVIDEDEFDRRASQDMLSGLVGGDAYPFRPRQPYRGQEEVLTLEPPRRRCAVCEQGKTHKPWRLFVGGEFVCDSRAIEKLCAVVREQQSLWKKPRGWYNDVMISECFMDMYDEMDLETKGQLVVHVSKRAVVEIPAREIAAWLDVWTPLWRLARRPAIEAAANAPPEEEV